jgi:geranylgeranyl diphosphate synthase type II
MNNNHPDKVEKVLSIFWKTGVDAWALELKQRYVAEASQHLEDIAVTQSRKTTLMELMHYLIQRDR